jgi:hypothetical protein
VCCEADSGIHRHDRTLRHEVFVSVTSCVIQWVRELAQTPRQSPEGGRGNNESDNQDRRADSDDHCQIEEEVERAPQHADDYTAEWQSVARSLTVTVRKEADLDRFDATLDDGKRERIAAWEPQ